MPCPYIGSDDNALKFLCTAFDLPAPGSKATRNAIDDAVAAADVELSYQGSDRNYIDALWDLLDAEPEPEPLVYNWSGSEEDVITSTLGSARAALSNENLTASRTFVGGLMGVGVTVGALPPGVLTNVNNALNSAVAGTITYTFVHQPTAEADFEGQVNPYNFTATIVAAGVPIGLAIITRIGETDDYSVSWVPAVGDTTLISSLATANVLLITFDGSGLYSVTIDGTPVVTDVAYTPAPLTPMIQIREYAGVTTGTGLTVSATLSHTLPVVAQE